VVNDIDDLHCASPGTLPNLTSFAWTLRSEKLGHKDILYAEVPIRNALLSVIAQHRFESFAIDAYAIGPPILPEYGDIFLNQLAEPGEQRVHVIEDKAVPVFVFRSFLGITEALIDYPPQFQDVRSKARDAIAPQVQGKFMSAFIRAIKPASCYAPGCCA